MGRTHEQQRAAARARTGAVCALFVGLVACGSAPQDAFVVETCAPPTHANAVPVLLAETGCFSTAANAAARLVPYTVTAPLWSDGASKRRWIYVPSGAKATLTSDEVLALPPGSAVFKEFSVGGVRVETR